MVFEKAVTAGAPASGNPPPGSEPKLEEIIVERELKNADAPNWFAETQRSLADSQLQLLGTPDQPQWDAAAILVTMWNQWNNVFRKTLGHGERTLVSELGEVRSLWAHQRPFSTDDAYRALDSAARLLAAVSALEADDVDKMKMELLRVRFDEQVRTEKRRSAAGTIETQPQTGLKPWREVVNPHQDVASGKYQQAEFAADLWQVHLGEGGDEYRQPVEFFRRTYLTESFETHFTFAQALTESAKLAKQCLLVVSLPTSDGTGSPHTLTDDIEVGGEWGRSALDRLRNAIGRVEASWRPASAEEGFEIVRRRLFEPLVEKEQFVARDTVAKGFFELYRTQQQEFPPECHDSYYERRLKAAYPDPSRGV